MNRSSDVPPPPAGTGAIDAAIRTFAASMPLQSARVQQGALEQISSQLSHSLSQQSTARDVALTLNASCALLDALSFSNKTTSGVHVSRSTDVDRSYQELLHVSIIEDELSSY